MRGLRGSLPLVIMKLHPLYAVGLLCLSARAAAAQGVYSQLGGYTEQAQQVAAAPPSPLSLFLQQDPLTAAAPPQFQVLGSPSVAAPLPPPVKPSPNFLAPFARPKGLLTLRTMRVANGGAEGSKIFFGANSEFAMGTDSAGNFLVEKAEAPAPLLSLDGQETLQVGSARLQVASLDAANGFSVKGVKQWQLVYSDDFSSQMGAGWSRSEVSQCAGVYMLGGFCKFSRGEVNKTFAGLPPHKQIKIVASYHFIDRWIGETGYMKLNVGTNNCGVTVWSEQHAQQEAKNGVSLCGDAGTPEGKFSVPVDVTVPHSRDSITVTFGSTMDAADPCDESWGISAVEIYIRD